MEFTYTVFTCMPGESYCRRLRSLLLYLCYIFWVLINSRACWHLQILREQSQLTRLPSQEKMKPQQHQSCYHGRCQEHWWSYRLAVPLMQSQKWEHWPGKVPGVSRRQLEVSRTAIQTYKGGDERQGWSHFFYQGVDTWNIVSVAV